MALPPRTGGRWLHVGRFRHPPIADLIRFARKHRLRHRLIRIGTAGPHGFRFLGNNEPGTSEQFRLFMVQKLNIEVCAAPPPLGGQDARKFLVEFYHLLRLIELDGRHVGVTMISGKINILPPVVVDEFILRLAMFQIGGVYPCFLLEKCRCSRTTSGTRLSTPRAVAISCHTVSM